MRVSRSSFYDWLTRSVSRQRIYTRYLGFKIKAIYEESRQTYGSPRITSCLEYDEGIKVSRPRVARIMRRLGLKSKLKKRFRVTTDSNHSYSLAPNLLERDFITESPGKVWVSDITYLSTNEGWAYLTMVMDLYDRKIIGWSLSHRMKTEMTTLPALEMALKNREKSNDLMFHSDRGIQYASSSFKKLLIKNNITQSMSRKGNCWDNAVAESFFKTLKTECTYHLNFKTRDEAMLEIFAYIETWYNRKRKHSALKYKTPLQMEQMFFNMKHKKTA